MTSRPLSSLALGLIGLLAASAIAHADPDALWKIVHDKCVVATAPCVSVNAGEHYALLKDQRGVAQHLLIPTDKITGIESPALLDAKTPNFFADAWNERAAVNAKLPHPLARDMLSLAVNAQNARSQNQLHIHIDCLSPDAHALLTKMAYDIGTDWASLPVAVAGHHFIAMKVESDTLAGYNPFLALAKILKDPSTEMASHNLVVVGASFASGPGFMILTDVVPAATIGFSGGEDVQDHSCRIDPV
ncbi:CDP-diacylglycerol diphosphatase [Agrobacterium vitis]|uniref:CDP-diacylglycerol diphosphatase n=1 Tax=Rhizobium/Agrobacterium group TaxID=227290 RepID=UPI0008DC048B|nr:MULTISPECIES: CDP-diacylglycerol diphosphatase [Rhizobium/Agrobacterium group]MCF1434836.1 CDP-diacylglycerol diphosphatase [Allorhizobium ampelinum]MUO92076.1 CDP-diacylglycerol diphosphatase [Agrobacterium vitis]MUZ53612.1 CDP-diacylglycerol diphosphatase [Agrobacterium vitis]MUZ93327.1 CDP-diacylglycerol diphosphatase [Agrobacterium vitis]MVA41035.1 CDP-diacylglycerol diphosphatase [Agrobacterium vitis]